jgi:amidase
MHFSEYRQFDGLGLANLVKKKEVTPLELIEVAIKRAQEVNPKINAINFPMFEEGQRLANSPLPEGVFKGVPFLLKDLLGAYKGFPMANGSEIYKNDISNYDAEIVKRFKKSGVVTFGKTNTPEFGILGVTEPKAFGPSRNPWNTDYTTGGSSGGSAAAVAAGIAPIASAGDGLGSIRIPSSCLGLFGLKPTRGRNPSGPHAGQFWSGAVSQHILSRSVRDSAAMLDQIHGPELGAPYQVFRPEESFLSQVEKDPRPLKIGYSLSHPLGLNIDEECKVAVMETLKTLEGLGHRVEESTPDLDGEEIAKTCLTMLMGQVASDIHEADKKFGKKARRKKLEVVTQTLGLLGRSLSAAEYVNQRRKWDQYAYIMAKYHERYDLFLTPTMAKTPFKIGSLDQKPHEVLLMKMANKLRLGKVLLKVGLVDAIAKENLKVVPFNQISNLTGQPAMSLPLHWTPDNLPVGVQFVAPFGQESLLFQVAGQLERAKPWSHKVPSL